ncbi:MAG: Rrf2 family transcriptional regulator [Pelagibacterales bacterium]|nr:Rrf2 family transcriptional regulator [Pelagibacterales bacterium]
MILTTKGRYAVLAIIDIADSADSEKATPLFAISQRQNISLSYLEQIFTKLRKAEIVKSSKGPGGGYFLNKDPKEITIAEIINAIGEPIRITSCSNKKEGCISNKETSKKCKTHDLWHGLEKRIYDYLYSISLYDVCSSSFPKFYQTTNNNFLS